MSGERLVIYKKRHGEKKLLEYSRYFKAVLITGARQVGKSTLLENLFPQLKRFVFDPIQDLYGVREDPDLFLDNFPPPLILDEIQYVPELIPALKRRMDLEEMAGQYFLTGSQNLMVLSKVVESMAGRVGIFHLRGMTPAEMSGRGEEKGWLADYLDEPESFLKRENGYYDNLGTLATFLWRGTLPGLLEKPDSIVPDYCRSYIQTYVERDVRLMENIRELAIFDRFLGLLGALTGQEINASQLGRDTGISPMTARKWLDLLSNSYQWLELFPYHGNSIKRLSGKRKGFLTDTGLACQLQRVTTPDALAVHPLLGPLFESWVVNYIHQQFADLSVAPQGFHWRTGGGAEVDLLLERDGRLYPIEVKCKTRLSKNDARGLRAFRETYPGKEIAPALIIYAGKDLYAVDRETLAVPWNLV